MLRVRTENPVSYALCNQTVSVYHQNADKSVTRTVYENAFFDRKKTQNVDAIGSHEANSFLLVLPCGEQCVLPGDKILLGAGPEIDTRDAWVQMIPSLVAGLVVVKYVVPKYWHGRMVHLEAGGWARRDKSL